MIPISEITLDVRHNNPDFAHNLKNAFPDLKIADLGAHMGDIRIVQAEKTALFEVKCSPNDFIESIKDRRLFNQAEGMRSVTPWAFLLHPDFHYDKEDKVYGVWDDGYGANEGWTRQHIEGALVAVQARGTICRPAYAGYIHAVKSVIEWLSDADTGSITRQVHKLSPFDEFDQDVVNMLTLFPKIGLVQAKNFLKWAGARLPKHKYWELATTYFEGDDKPKGWTNATITRNRMWLGYKEEWHEELDG